MKIVPLTEADYPTIIEWGNNDPALMGMWLAAGETFDSSKESEDYVLKVDDIVVGFLNIFNIIPGESGEFGISIPDKRGTIIAARATVKYLYGAFKRWNLKYIYITPITEKSRIGAEFIGFKNNFITPDVLEGKWSKWLL